MFEPIPPRQMKMPLRCYGAVWDSTACSLRFTLFKDAALVFNSVVWGVMFAQKVKIAKCVNHNVIFFSIFHNYVRSTDPSYSVVIGQGSTWSVWEDFENEVNGSDFSKVKILRKRSSAHAQLIKISHFYVKTGHSGKLIVQSGLFICRSENTFKCFIRHISTECIWQKYTFVWQIKFYLLSKLVNSVSDDDVIKSE